MKPSFFTLGAAVCVLAATSYAQPGVSTRSKAEPVPIGRKAMVVKPQVYRLPAELTGGEAHPFATEFYLPKQKAKRPAAAKRPARAAQR